jgi:hypothetical protein
VFGGGGRLLHASTSSDGSGCLGGSVCYVILRKITKYFSENSLLWAEI